MLRTPADPDLCRGDGRGSAVALVERPVLRVVAFAVPVGSHQPDCLVGAPAAPVELNPHEIERVLASAHRDTEREAAAGALL
jgi:hypothetical protein